MKEIKTTQVIHIPAYILVDDEDFDYLNQYHWYIGYNGKTYYAWRGTWVNGKRICIYMHRLIMNTPKGKQTHHIDGDGLNNQKSNLKVCTVKEHRLLHKINKE